MPFFPFDKASDGDVVGIEYWNANGKGMAIVAVKGYADDWAAYIGADDGWREADCIEWTIRHGCKLSHRLATAIFPRLPAELWRR